MDAKRLKTELSKGQLRRIYLLHGDEKFLISHYAAEIEKTVSGNEPLYKDAYDNTAKADEIIMAADTVPFFGEKRLVCVKDSKLFAAGRKAEAEQMAEYLPKIPEETVLLFIESEIDRRTRLYKKVQELDGTLDCTPPGPSDLIKWLTRLASERSKVLTFPTADLLIKTCGTDMTNLYGEMDKLIHYIGDNGKEITPKDIKAISTPTLEAKIFALTKAMGDGRTGDALKAYHDMIILKESPIMILTMIIRQLRITLLCKCALERKLPRAQIAKDLNIRDFVISEAATHGRRFTEKGLISALEHCQDTDIRVKTGLLDPEIGVEMLLIGLSESTP